MKGALFCCRISQRGTRLSRVFPLTPVYVKTAFSLFGWFWSFENCPETLHLQTHEKSSSRRNADEKPQLSTEESFFNQI